MVRDSITNSRALRQFILGFGAYGNCDSTPTGQTVRDVGIRDTSRLVYTATVCASGDGGPNDSLRCTYAYEWIQTTL
jgi:hypothetical protein